MRIRGIGRECARQCEEGSCRGTRGRRRACRAVGRGEELAQAESRDRGRGVYGEEIVDVYQDFSLSSGG